MPTRAVLTYSNYAALPDDGRRYELHQGELSPIPAPGTQHQGTLVALISLLYKHVRSRGLGKVFVAPTDCILSNVTVVQPDVLYVAPDRLAIISERGIEGAPTLTLEVLSPSTAHLDRDRKMKLYAEHGVPYYWIADPESRAIEAYALAGAEYARAGRVTSEPAALPPFSDLTIDPASIWPSRVLSAGDARRAKRGCSGARSGGRRPLTSGVRAWPVPLPAISQPRDYARAPGDASRAPCAVRRSRG